MKVTIEMSPEERDVLINDCLGSKNAIPTLNWYCCMWNAAYYGAVRDLLAKIAEDIKVYDNRKK